MSDDKDAAYAERMLVAHNVPHAMHAFGHEIDVSQNTPRWMEARGKCMTTASVISELTGKGIVGAWSPIEHTRHARLYEDTKFEGNADTAHGHLHEPLIAEIYEKYIAHATSTPGWKMGEGKFFMTPPIPWLGNKTLGASPDGNSVLPGGMRISQEFKAPVNGIYRNCMLGVKDAHLCQMQFQMGIMNVLVADYVAICFKTREVTAVRVWFSKPFYEWICECLQRVHHWYEMPLEEFSKITRHSREARMPEWPIETVYMLPLAMVYPDTLTLKHFLPSVAEVDAFVQLHGEPMQE